MSATDPTAPGSIRLNLFGEFAVKVDSAQQNLPTRRTAEVLAFLALHNHRSVPRSRVAAEIWWDAEDSFARQSLRRALSSLRKALGPDALLSSDHGLVLAEDLECDLDLATRAEKRARQSQDPEEQLSWLLRCFGLVESPLLMQWDAVWVDPYRLHWSRTRQRLASQISDHFWRRGRFADCLTYAMKGLEVDHGDESFAAWVLKCLSALGRVQDARLFFRDFADHLKSEFNLEPTPTLGMLYRDLIESNVEVRGVPPVQDEDVLNHLVAKVFASEPGMLINLLASEGLAWTLFVRGRDVIPILTKALDTSHSWTDGHRRVARDLLQIAALQSRFDLVHTYGDLLRTHVVEGSYDDVVCDCLVSNASWSEGQLEAALVLGDRALAKAKSLGSPYLESVILGNRALINVESGRYEEGLILILQQIRELDVSTTQRGRLALAQAYGIAATAYLMLDDLAGATEAIQNWQHLSSVTGVGELETGNRALHGWILTRSGRRGGAEAVVESLTKSLQQRNHGVFVASLLYAIGALAASGKIESAKILATKYRALRDAGNTSITPQATDTLIQIFGGAAIHVEHSPVANANLSELLSWICEELGL